MDRRLLLALLFFVLAALVAAVLIVIAIDSATPSNAATPSEPVIRAAGVTAS